MNNKTIDKPAILGGTPIFETKLPMVVPDFPTWYSVRDKFEDVFNKETIFTKGKYLREFEENIADHLNVKHAIGLSSCTSGLMLLYRILDLKGEVILPSFTFMATGLSLMWINNLTPVFVDVDPDTFTICPKEVQKHINNNTAAIIGVHTFGNPVHIDELISIAKKNNTKLIFDSAHGLGSLYNGQPLGGYGDAESFSCSPTKLLITGEGGIVTTNNDELANQLRIGREYGNPGNYDSLFAGMNARMCEFNAIMGIESLQMLNNIVNERNRMAKYLKERLSFLQGIKFQFIDQKNVSSYKDFTIVIEEEFELSRDQLVEALKAENIETRNYYSPPLHLQTTFKSFQNRFKEKLPVTEKLSNSAVTLPLSSKFSIEQVDKLCLAIEKIYHYRKEINNL
ncbi:MAG: DegT/DnrJ/EryC1/StrS family aminotransferase [Cyanobacteriota bacterium]